MACESLLVRSGELLLGDHLIPMDESQRTLRVGATLVFGGVLISLVAGFFHPNQAPANDHAAAFAEYAASDVWIAVHLGQFVGMMMIVAGLVALFPVLDARPGRSGWAGRFGAVAAVLALGLYGVLQAVDGVALKHAVDAWATAPKSERAARFASAEAIRWLEWSVRSYHSYLLGASFLLYGTVVTSTAGLPRPIGYIMGLSGLAYIAQGWVIGSQGFSSANAAPTLAGIILVLTWSVWLLANAWRKFTAHIFPTT